MEETLNPQPYDQKRFSDQQQPSERDDFMMEEDNFSPVRPASELDMFDVNVGSTLESEPSTEFLTPEQSVASSAHSFRSRRLRQGPLGEYVSGVRRDLITHGLIKAFRSVSHELNGTEQGTRAPEHRALNPFIVGIMNDPDARKAFMGALDETARQESDAMKESGTLHSVDVLIVGAGAQGAVAAARLREENPQLSILSIDKAQQLGGQFRSYGPNPSFRINSRGHRVNNNDLALPGGEGNLNPFSEVSVVQLPDMTTETYPTNTDMGDAIALNQFFSAPTLLGVEMVARTEKDGRELATVRDTETGREHQILAQNIILLTGSGERDVINPAENVWTVEDLLRHFGDDTERFPMAKFIGKSIAVIGGGDSARIAVELLTRLAPKEAYSNSVAQLGGPESIAWYGVNFESREEFCTTNRSRYEQISAFISNPDEAVSTARPILPKKARVTGIVEQADKSIAIVDDNGDRRFYDVVIDATNLQRQLAKIEGLNTDYRPQNVNFDTIGSSSSGLLIDRTRTYIGGPAAATRLTPVELGTFPDTIRENTVALWANAPRVDQLAKDIARQLVPKR